MTLSPELVREKKNMGSIASQEVPFKYVLCDNPATKRNHVSIIVPFVADSPQLQPDTRLFGNEYSLTSMASGKRVYINSSFDITTSICFGMLSTISSHYLCIFEIDMYRRDSLSFFFNSNNDNDTYIPKNVKELDYVIAYLMRLTMQRGYNCGIILNRYSAKHHTFETIKKFTRDRWMQVPHTGSIYKYVINHEYKQLNEMNNTENIQFILNQINQLNINDKNRYYRLCHIQHFCSFIIIGVQLLIMTNGKYFSVPLEILIDKNKYPMEGPSCWFYYDSNINNNNNNNNHFAECVELHYFEDKWTPNLSLLDVVYYSYLSLMELCSGNQLTSKTITAPETYYDYVYGSHITTMNKLLNENLLVETMSTFHNLFPICLCGCQLVPLKPQLCYTNESKDGGKTRKQNWTEEKEEKRMDNDHRYRYVVCDACEKSIQFSQSNTTLFHCPNVEMSKYHPYGFDICLSCVYKYHFRLKQYNVIIICPYSYVRNGPNSKPIAKSLDDWKPMTRLFKKLGYHKITVIKGHKATKNNVKKAIETIFKTNKQDTNRAKMTNTTNIVNVIVYSGHGSINRQNGSFSFQFSRDREKSQKEHNNDHLVSEAEFSSWMHESEVPKPELTVGDKISQFFRNLFSDDDTKTDHTMEKLPNRDKCEYIPLDLSIFEREKRDAINGFIKVQQAYNNISQMDKGGDFQRLVSLLFLQIKNNMDKANNGSANAKDNEPQCCFDEEDELFMNKFLCMEQNQMNTLMLINACHSGGFHSLDGNGARDGSRYCIRSHSDHEDGLNKGTVENFHLIVERYRQEEKCDEVLIKFNNKLIDYCFQTTQDLLKLADNVFQRQNQLHSNALHDYSANVTTVDRRRPRRKRILFLDFDKYDFFRVQITLRKEIVSMIPIIFKREKVLPFIQSMYMKFLNGYFNLLMNESPDKTQILTRIQLEIEFVRSFKKFTYAVQNAMVISSCRKIEESTGQALSPFLKFVKDYLKQCQSQILSRYKKNEIPLNIGDIYDTPEKLYDYILANTNVPLRDLGISLKELGQNATVASQRGRNIFPLCPLPFRLLNNKSQT